MMQPTEYGNRLDAALELGRSGNGLLMGEGLMRARLVVEARELDDETSKVRVVAKNSFRRDSWGDRA
jgi:hypothetical protein